MNIKVISATVVLGDGMDSISLHTNLPCPYTYEFAMNQPNLMLEFTTTKDTGVDYVKKHFGIKPEVIDMRKSVREFKFKS